MNVFNKITREALRKNRSRTLVTIIGIILSSALITGVTCFVASMQHFMVRAAISETGNWHAAFWETTADEVSRISQDPAVAAYFVTQELGTVQVETVNDLAITNTVAIGDDVLEGLPLPLVAGRLPENPDEVLVPDWYQSTYAIGQRYSFTTGMLIDNSTHAHNSSEAVIFIPTGSVDYTVVGFYRNAYPGTWGQRRPLITRMDDNASPTQHDAYNLLVQLEQPRRTASFIESQQGDELFAEPNQALVQYYGVFQQAGFVATFYLLSVAMVLIVMICAISLIYNAFDISVSERSRQFGILSSVGATRKQLASSVVHEGLIVAGIGIPMGILLGIGGVGLALRLVGGAITDVVASDLAPTLVVSIPVLGAAAAISLATILLSAAIPAYRATRVPAIEAIRQTQDITVRPKAVRSGSLATRIFGLEGALAQKSIRRNNRRYRSAIISLAVSVAVLVSTASLMLYMDRGRDETVANTRYNVVLYMPLDLSQTEAQFTAIYDQMRAEPHVTDGLWVLGSSSYLQSSQSVYSECRMAAELATYTSEIPDDVGAINIAFMPDEAFVAYLNEIGLEPTGFLGVGAPRTLAMSQSRVSGVGGRIERCENYANESANSGQPVDVTLINTHNPGLTESADRQVVTLTDFTAQSPDFGAFAFANYDIILPASRSAEFANSFDGLSPHFLFDSNDSSATTDYIEALLLSQGQPQSVINQTLTDLSAVNNANQRTNLIASIFGYGFIAMLSLIAVASVFNTVTTSVRLRRRELAMLKSIGMTDGSFHRMLSYECLFFGTKALLYGLPIALIANVLVYLAVGHAIELPFQLPWPAIGAAVLGVFAVVFAAMRYGLQKTNRENVIDVLRTDAV